MPKKKKTTVITVGTVEMPIIGHIEQVPELDNNYHFGPEAEDIALDIRANKKLLLSGHTGCGKTSVIKQIAARMEQGVLRVNLNGQMTISDFVGTWTVQNGEMNWIDGALVTAMKKGYWLILDEIDFADASILASLNAVMESKGEFMLKEKGSEVVKADSNFRIIATANTAGQMQEYRYLYQGANLLNEAFLDRFRVHLCEYPSEENEIKILKNSNPVIASLDEEIKEKIARKIVSVANKVRESFMTEELGCTFSVRKCLDWCELIMRYEGDFLRAAKTSILSKVSREDAAVIQGIISRVCLE